MLRYSQRRRAERLLAHRHGLPRHVGFDRPGAAARRRRRPDRPLRRASTRPTAATRYRYSGSVEWQRHARQRSHQGHRLRHRATTSNLFSNFTYFLDDPGARRSVRAGRSPLRDRRARSTHRRLGALGAAARCRTPSACRCATTTSRTSGCITPRRGGRSTRSARTRVAARRAPASTRRTRSQWTPWLRTLAGLRVDGYRFDVDAGDPRERRHAATPASSARRAARCSARGSGTELYVNAGIGFHSNDARGATITRRSGDGRAGGAGDAAGARQRRGGGRAHRAHPAPADQPCAVDAGPRLRAGVRRRRRHDRSRPPEPPHGVEFANYYSPAAVADARRRPRRCRSARFTDGDPAGEHDSRARSATWSRPAPRSTACSRCSAASAGATSVRGR